MNFIFFSIKAHDKLYNCWFQSIDSYVLKLINLQVIHFPLSCSNVSFHKQPIPCTKRKKTSVEQKLQNTKQLHQPRYQSSNAYVQTQKQTYTRHNKIRYATTTSNHMRKNVHHSHCFKMVRSKQPLPNLNLSAHIEEDGDTETTHTH